MRHRLETWLNRIWYGGEEAPAWLKALVPLYRIGYLLDRLVKRRQQPAALRGRAIVVVGNLSVGGSGKTPLVIRLCRVLQQAGLKPGVVSRGYGRKRGGMVEVTRESDALNTGDEPLVIARRSGVPVVVAADRCSAAVLLFQRGVDVVIADDGLQHHRLPRRVEICVVDGERDFGNGRLLPAGPLREPLKRLPEFDFVIVNAGSKPVTETANTVRMNLVPGLLYALEGDESWRLTQFVGCRVNAVAGIGNPERFFRTLQHAGLQVLPHVFPDHHGFTRADFARLEPGIPVIMTEKDAVKCRGMGLENAWYLAVEASLPSAWESALLSKLSAALPGETLRP
ncbi:MAG TPA: tetraacyldisaccharide 4'-kinase [Xanthomonadales bacterium]|nr:tetraacyldisaccharide 4'-kinase [Xanthomonadales bacterium]